MHILGTHILVLPCISSILTISILASDDADHLREGDRAFHLANERHLVVIPHPRAPKEAYNESKHLLPHACAEHSNAHRMCTYVRTSSDPRVWHAIALAGYCLHDYHQKQQENQQPADIA